jgi:quercetin dioxygenase-like cupin family protein
MRFSICCLLLAILIGPAFRSARAQDKPAHTAKAATEFMNFPGLPTCVKGSVKNGDPSKSGTVILAKSTAPCLIPWHWHTANEQLMMVSGSAKVEMKDAKPAAVHASGFLALPGKNPHQFTCVAACTFFIVSDAAFDIHYVDKDGKEISADDALKSKAKAPMKKEMKDMKDMKM